MLVLGVSLAAAARALPDAKRVGAIREGGTFRVALFGVDSVDPALAYFPTSWVVLDATCAKLMNYPDRGLPDGLRPTPEVAVGPPAVSPDGKVYTFRIRRGFTFSDGAKLTARSFQRAIERLADPAMKSPAAEVGYVQDIVGAERVLTGQAKSLSGVRVRGNYRLVITLTRRVPDFTARLAMPFFCAVPPGLPANPEGVKEYPSAGPYYVAEYVPGRRLVLRENRHYRGKRPHHVERFLVDLTHGPQQIVDEIGSGRADWGHLAPFVLPGRLPGLVRRYGVNRSRLFIRPSPNLRYFVLNTERPLLKNNARLRRAINFAVDRTALAAEHGYRSVRPSDQYLPVGFPGFRNVRIYPNR